MQDKTLYVEENEIRQVTRQWAADCERADTTIEDSTWTWTGAGLGYGGTYTTVLATVTLNPLSNGVLTNTVTFANGERRSAWRYVVCEALANGAAEDEVVEVIESEGGGLVEQE